MGKEGEEGRPVRRKRVNTFQGVRPLLVNLGLERGVDLRGGVPVHLSPLHTHTTVSETASGSSDLSTSAQC